MENGENQQKSSRDLITTKTDARRLAGKRSAWERVAKRFRFQSFWPANLSIGSGLRRFAHAIDRQRGRPLFVELAQVAIPG